MTPLFPPDDHGFVTVTVLLVGGPENGFDCDVSLNGGEVGVVTEDGCVGVYKPDPHNYFQWLWHPICTRTV